MPPAKEKSKPQRSASTDTNQKCKICRKTIPYNRHLSCDLCTEPICVPCTKLGEENFDYLEEQDIEIPFLCSPCRKELPKIRELLKLKDQFKQLEESVSLLTTKVEEVQKKADEEEDLDIGAIDKRLTKVEEVIKEKQIDEAEFPPLKKITDQSEKINQVVQKQKRLDEKLKKQSEEKIEEKRIEEKENSLVIYGIPEAHQDRTEQLKQDFKTINQLYEDRLTITPDEITSLTRLGKQNNGNIRPIRITFASSEKRLKVLRNNKNLVLYDDKFSSCTASFCNLEDNQHRHIYVSTDKTKQQREIEKTLRDEIKERKLKGENDLIIRNYKIVKYNERAYPRWADLVKDGF